MLLVMFLLIGLVSCSDNNIPIKQNIKYKEQIKSNDELPETYFTFDGEITRMCGTNCYHLQTKDGYVNIKSEEELQGKIVVDCYVRGELCLLKDWYYLDEEVMILE